MRRYDDPVEVRRGPSADPDQFWWRGRAWWVRHVHSHWVETAARHRTGRSGVIDLALCWADGG